MKVKIEINTEDVTGHENLYVQRFEFLDSPDLQTNIEWFVCRIIAAANLLEKKTKG